MEPRLLRSFQRQVLLQSRFILRAGKDINVALKNQDIEGVFYGVQAILTCAANVSKALWGQGEQWSCERREIRESIGVTDESPFRGVTMRNHYEHFDERIEKWERQSKRHNYADLNIGPRSGFDFVDELDQFRMFDPETAELRFWGQAFNIQDLVNEVQAILPKLEEEANRPHHAQ